MTPETYVQPGEGSNVAPTPHPAPPSSVPADASAAQFIATYAPQGGHQARYMEACLRRVRAGKLSSAAFLGQFAGVANRPAMATALQALMPTTPRRGEA
jgi:hypothetical protein